MKIIEQVSYNVEVLVCDNVDTLYAHMIVNHLNKVFCDDLNIRDRYKHVEDNYTLKGN